MVYYLVYLRSYSNLTTQRITNFFENLQDLINIIKFPQDLVVDDVDGEKWTIKLNSRMKLSFPFIYFKATGFNNWFALAPPTM